MQGCPKCVEKGFPLGILEISSERPQSNCSDSGRCSTFTRHQGVLAVENMRAPEIAGPHKGMLVYIFYLLPSVSGQPDTPAARIRGGAELVRGTEKEGPD